MFLGELHFPLMAAWSVIRNLIKAFADLKNKVFGIKVLTIFLNSCSHDELNDSKRICNYFSLFSLRL